MQIVDALILDAKWLARGEGRSEEIKYTESRIVNHKIFSPENVRVQ